MTSEWGDNSYYAACSAGAFFFGAIQNAAGRSNRKSARSASASRQIKIATDADNDFILADFPRSTAVANSRILATLNEVEGIYETELNLSFSVS